jgi:hypothetical protein
VVAPKHRLHGTHINDEFVEQLWVSRMFRSRHGVLGACANAKAAMGNCEGTRGQKTMHSYDLAV